MSRSLEAHGPRILIGGPWTPNPVFPNPCSFQWQLKLIEETTTALITHGPSCTDSGKQQYPILANRKVIQTSLNRKMLEVASIINQIDLTDITEHFTQTQKDISSFQHLMELSQIENIKKIVHHEIHPRDTGIVSIPKSINIIHFRNRLKGKNNMIISLDAERAFDKKQQPFMILLQQQQ